MAYTYQNEEMQKDHKIYNYVNQKGETMRVYGGTLTDEEKLKSMKEEARKRSPKQGPQEWDLEGLRETNKTPYPQTWRKTGTQGQEKESVTARTQERTAAKRVHLQKQRRNKTGGDRKQGCHTHRRRGRRDHRGRKTQKSHYVKSIA